MYSKITIHLIILPTLLLILGHSRVMFMFPCKNNLTQDGGICHWGPFFLQSHYTQRRLFNSILWTVCIACMKVPTFNISNMTQRQYGTLSTERKYTDWFSGYLTISCLIQSLYSHHEEKVRIYVAMAYFKTLTQNSPAETEENHKNPARIARDLNESQIHCYHCINQLEIGCQGCQLYWRSSNSQESNINK